MAKPPATRPRGRPRTEILEPTGVRLYPADQAALEAWAGAYPPDRQPGLATLIRDSLRAALVSLQLLDAEARKALEEAGWRFSDAATWIRPPPPPQTRTPVAVARPKPRPPLVSTVAPGRRRVGA